MFLQNSYYKKLIDYVKRGLCYKFNFYKNDLD